MAPLTLKAIDVGFAPARYQLYWLLDHGRSCGIRPWRELATTTSQLGLEAVEQYDNGIYCDSNFVLKYYSYNAIEKSKDYGKPLSEKHVRMRRAYVKKNPTKFAYRQFGITLATTNLKPGNPDVAKRAANLLTIGGSSPYSRYWLLQYYHNDGYKVKMNAPKWIAVMKITLKKSPGHFHRSEEREKQQYDFMWSTLNAEEEKKAKELIKDGFPFNQENVKKAYEELKESGDLSKDLKIPGKDADGKKEDIGQDVFWQDEEVDESRKTARLPSQKVTLVDDRRQKMLQKYLAGGDFKKDDRQSLAAALLLDEKDFQKMLEKAEAETGKNAQSKKIREVMETLSQPDRGDNRWGAPMGWWIVRKDGRHTSLPFIYQEIEKDSFAAKNGLGRQDIIEACQGLPLYSLESRNNFMRLLRLWPKNLPRDLLILREQYVDGQREHDPLTITLP